ncbi:hypothetical protein MTO96_035098 [Rhipicephalus appendiculatus]
MRPTLCRDAEKTGLQLRAFEEFFGLPCLILQVMKMSGLSEDDSQQEVAAAENRLRDSFFIITGVVKKRVQCWPSKDAQIGCLNIDCWREIARYLRVSDVRCV